MISPWDWSWANTDGEVRAIELKWPRYYEERITTRSFFNDSIDQKTPIEQGRYAGPEAPERLFSRTQWSTFGGKSSGAGNRDHRDAHPQER